MSESEEFRKAGMERPADDFTSKLMQQIDAEERALHSLLQAHGKLETSPDFALQFMAQLEGKHVKAKANPRPVLSLRTWIGIAASFALIAVFLLMQGGGNGSSLMDKNYLSFLDGASNMLSENKFLIYLAPICSLFVLALIFETRTAKRRI